MKLPKDRDFVETEEGFIFCLVGYLHPPERYTAHLKYTRAEAGRWARGAVRFHRELEYYHVRKFSKTLDSLRTHHPRYMSFDPVRNLSFSFVPQDAVTTYYRPEERFQAILARPADPLEKDVEALVSLLVGAGGPDPDAFGITGSTLLNIHDPSFSDIDLLVYGRDATASVRAPLDVLKKSCLIQVDAADSIFLPACYTLADVVIGEGQQWQMTELVSYEGLYCQVADRGDRIVACGAVEQVDDGPCRLVVGAAGLPEGGFLKLLRG